MSTTLERNAKQGCASCGNSGKVLASADGYGGVSFRCDCGHSSRDTSDMPLLLAEMTIAAVIAIFAVSAMLLLT